MSVLQRLMLSLAVFVLLAPGLFAQQKLAQLVVGKWRPVDEEKLKIIVEFTPEGRLVLYIEDKVIKGNYRVLSDAELEVSLQVEDKTLTEKLKVTINADRMTTEDSKGKKDTFQRVK